MDNRIFFLFFLLAIAHACEWTHDCSFGICNQETKQCECPNKSINCTSEDMGIHGCCFISHTCLHGACCHESNVCFDECCPESYICNEEMKQCIQEQEGDPPCSTLKDDGFPCTESICVLGECKNINITGGSCPLFRNQTGGICAKGICTMKIKPCADQKECDKDIPCAQQACIDNMCLVIPYRNGKNCTFIHSNGTLFSSTCKDGLCINIETEIGNGLITNKLKQFLVNAITGLAEGAALISIALFFANRARSYNRYRNNEVKRRGEKESENREISKKATFAHKKRKVRTRRLRPIKKKFN